MKTSISCLTLQNIIKNCNWMMQNSAVSLKCSETPVQTCQIKGIRNQNGE